MNNKYKLKEGITSDFLHDTKFDVREWSEADKTLWQEAMFSLGFSWGGSTMVDYLDYKAYFLEEDKEITHIFDDVDFFHEQKETELFWQDIFEPITLEQTEQSQESVSEPLQEELPAEEHNWVKCDFSLTSEALQAFEEGVEFYTKRRDGTFDPLRDCEVEIVLGHRGKYLYTKETKPWWEVVSSEKPCYVISNVGKIIKVERFSEEVDKLLKTSMKTFEPITEEKVKDIVETMKEWK